MLELSIYDNLLLTLLSFFTAMMTSIAGAGGGTVLLAAMLQFMNPSEAIPVHGVIQFTSNIARTCCAPISHHRVILNTHFAKIIITNQQISFRR